MTSFSFHSEKSAVKPQTPLTMSSSQTTLRTDASPASEPPSEQRPNAYPVEDDHQEKDFKYKDIVKDIVLGAADGLTVPFALTAGLSSIGSSKLVILGGLAELFSGAISMGLGAWLQVDCDRENYVAEWNREEDEVNRWPMKERQECYDILESYNIPHNVIMHAVNSMSRDDNHHNWIQFMMDLELKLEPKPTKLRAYQSAACMGGSYFIGGLIPMIPYFIMQDNVTHALFASIGLTAFVLLVFGFVKNWFLVGTTKSGFYGSIQTLCVGAAAAGASYGIVRAINSTDSGVACAA